MTLNFEYSPLGSLEHAGTAAGIESLDEPPLQDNYSPYKAHPIDAIIRLLKFESRGAEASIEISLIQVNLKHLPRYRALSYVWGSQDRTENIRCNGCDLKITSSLLSALQRIRSQDSAAVLWVDAICINQSDLEEKQQQVLLMDSIYALSQSVLIWLGEEAVDDQRATEYIRRLDPILMDIERRHMHGTELYGSPTRFLEMRSAICDSPSSLEDFCQVVRLLERPWFHRMWTVQEFAKASQPVLMYGKRTLQAQELANVLHRMLWNIDHITARLQLDETIKTNFITLAESFTSIHSLRYAGAGGQKESPLHNLLAMTRLRQTTEPKDRLYSLRSLAAQKEKELVDPDYDPTLTYHDVFKRFTISTFVKLQSLDYLVPSGSIPSWFRDPAALTDYDAGLRKDNRLYNASAQTPPSVQVADDILSVLGTRVDGLEQLSVASSFKKIQSQDVLSSEALEAWLQTTYSMAAESYTSEAMLASWARTLVLARQPYWAVLLKEAEVTALQVLLVRLLAAFNERKLQTTGDRVALDDKTTFSDEELEMISGLRACLGKKFCLTSYGRFAIVPPSSRSDDVVSILYGHGIPQVLRDVGSGCYRLIGGCYIDGLMYGEALTMGEREDEVFKIR